MKKMILTIAIILTTGLIFANNDGEKITNEKSEITIEMNNSLKPETPKEATFDDEVINNDTIKSLSPVTPKEASFEE